MAMEVISECAQPITDAANNNLKSRDCAQPNKPQSSRPASAPAPMCVGCSRPVLDKYVMKVHPDLDWHMSCLKCVECHRLLDENCTCYLKDGKTYCKSDYHRLFLTSCSKCGNLFTTSDLVMRAESNVYHIECFSCTACSRRLMPGDDFALREGGLFCREDNEVLERNQLLERDDDNLISIHNNNNNHHKLHLPQDKHHQTSLHHDTNKNIKRKDGKPTRVRTVLSEKQLHTLRTCYQANPRPDALMKEQLVEMTNLSPRVIRVWFQNKRCKDKKRTILLKHLQQQEKMPGPLQGVAMVAQSPLRHENGLKTIEAYHHQNWKQMPDYGSHQDEISHSFPSSLIGSLYGSDDSAVYIGEDEYMDCIQPDSVSSHFSGASTSPHSST